MLLFNSFLTYLLTYLVVVSPVVTLTLFLPVVSKYLPAQKRVMAIKGTSIAFIFLAVLIFFGVSPLHSIGISISAIKISGGLVLFLNALLTFINTPLSTVSMVEEDVNTHTQNKDISAFPLAIPVIAGPAAISLTIILTEEIGDNFALKIMLVLALLVNLLLSLSLLLLSDIIMSKLPKSVVNSIIVIGTLMVLALGCQYIIAGIKEFFY